MNFNAAVLISKKKIVIDTLKIPKLREGQVLVKMIYSSICQTQIGEINGTRGKDPYLPHCLGHEAVGKIMEKHASVKKVKVEDNVCLSWIKGSGIDAGGTKYENLKGKIINAGPVNTFSEYAVISENRIYKLLKKDDLKSSVLLGCAIPTGFNSIFYSLKKIKKGPICILGCGGVGLAVVMASKLKNIRPIIGIDISEKKMKIAKSFGADKTFNFNDKNFEKVLTRFCQSNFPAFIECTGKINVLEFCIKKTNTLGGQVVVVGNYPKNSSIDLDPWHIISGKTLMGAWNDNKSFDHKFDTFKKKLDKDCHNNFFGKSTYSLEEIDIAVDDFVKGKVVRPLIEF